MKNKKKLLVVFLLFTSLFFNMFNSSLVYADTKIFSNELNSNVLEQKNIGESSLNTTNDKIFDTSNEDKIEKNKPVDDKTENNTYKDENRNISVNQQTSENIVTKLYVDEY
ncbi:hypothetical protein QYB80_003188 [Clostridium perfringens]|nr:hypothetical protein [Clostridium perfringens]MDK0554319.1 hypothetical protein [Clostridium perfringens]